MTLPSKEKTVRELTAEELSMVSGGVRWDEVGAGLGAAALAITIVSTPVGWAGLTVAGALAYGGGVAIGDGLTEGPIFSSR